MLYSGLGNISSFLSCGNQIEHLPKNMGYQVTSISAKFMTAQSNAHILWCEHMQILILDEKNWRVHRHVGHDFFFKCSDFIVLKSARCYSTIEHDSYSTHEYIQIPSSLHTHCYTPLDDTLERAQV